jgi:hypothetical protein
LIFLMNSAPQCAGRDSETFAAQDPKLHGGGGRGPPPRRAAGDRGVVGQRTKSMNPSDRSIDKVMDKLDKRPDVVKVRTSLSQPYPTLYP